VTVVNTHSPLSAEFLVNDAVRLLDPHCDVPSGTVGRILGKFPRPTDTTYVVCVVDERLSVLEIFANEIVPVDDFGLSAASA
jgi:hypothetical protein